MDSLSELDQMLADLSATGSKEPKDEGAGAGFTSNDGMSGHVAAATTSKIESKPEIKKLKRRSSFSKTKGVDSSSEDGELNPNYVKTEDLEGVVVKRVPLAEPDFESGEIRKLMEYQVHNTRSNPARLLLEFQGHNISITPMGLASMVPPHSVTVMLAAGFSGSVATAGPASLKEEYSFTMNMRVTPVELKEETDEELQGVILTRTVTHDDLTYVDFRIKNTRTFAIEVGINVVGEYKSRGFETKKLIKAGEETSLGGVSNDGDVSTSWHWKGLEPVDADGNVAKKVDENDYAESELKGVFLGRVVFPGVDGAPGSIRFRVRNTLEKSVAVDVTVTGDVVGDGKVLKTVAAGSTEKIGQVDVKGQMSIQWKWQAADA